MNASRRSKDLPPRAVHRSALAALAAALLMAAPQAWAESGTLFTKSQPGWNMSVDMRWVDAGGYRPVRFIFTPTTAANEPRTLLVEFTVHDWRWPDEDDVVVEQEVVVPPGLNPVEATLAVPQLGPMTNRSIRVFEDGDELEGLASSRISTGIDFEAWQEGWPTVLFVGTDSPDASSLGQVLGVPGEEKRTVDPNGIEQITRTPKPPAELPTGMTRSIGELPRRWIDYTSLDIIFLSLSDVRKLADARPESWDAIRRWTAAGGNLIVYGVGDSPGGRRELARALDLSADDKESQEKEEQLWRTPHRANYDAKLHAFSFEPARSYNRIPSAFSNLTNEMEKLPKPVTSPPPAETPFVWRSYQQGAVVAIDSAEPFPGEPADWAWILNTLTTPRWTWFERHGVSVSRDNIDFWNFLIPGVGLAPVTEFRVLITLFVLLIGPVNYFFLQRRDKVHLMVLTVPSFAAAVTLALFLYGLVSDGLSVRVRPRSFTEIDQRTGQTTCWSRLSYYAGLAPGGGLTFSDDVLVVPIEPTGDDYSRDSNRRTRFVRWGEEQRLESGWLPSRSPTQLLTVRSRESEWGLRITEGDSAGATGTVHNELGTPIRQLFVVGASGQAYWADNVAVDAEAALQPIDYRQALVKLKATYDAAKPTVPPGVNPSGRNSLFGFRNRRFWGYSAGNIQPAATMTSRLEDGIAWAEDPTRWTSGTAAGSLDPSVYRTYLAIVDVSPEVEYGFDGARPESAFHVIRGKW